jgi:hypothetical protein
MPQLRPRNEKVRANHLVRPDNRPPRECAAVAGLRLSSPAATKTTSARVHDRLWQSLPIVPRMSARTRHFYPIEFSFAAFALDLCYPAALEPSRTALVMERQSPPHLLATLAGLTCVFLQLPH